MDNGRRGPIQKIAIMTDDEHRMGIAAHIFFKPQCSLQIEIVCWLIKQQQIRFGKQHGSECHAHAPSAGKTGSRTLLCLIVKPKTR